MKTTTIIVAALAIMTATALADDIPTLWDKNCASCHGKDGKGKTKAGRIAGVKDLTDAAYQKSFTDEHAFEGILKGRKDDKGKEQMKPFAGKMTEDEMKGLVKHVRSLK